MQILILDKFKRRTFKDPSNTTAFSKHEECPISASLKGVDCLYIYFPDPICFNSYFHLVLYMVVMFEDCCQFWFNRIGTVYYLFGFVCDYQNKFGSDSRMASCVKPTCLTFWTSRCDRPYKTQTTTLS